MKTRALMFLVVVLCCAATLRAQKADFAAAERFAPENLREMVGDRRVTPHWLHDSDRFWYSYETGEGTNYYLVDPQKGTKELLFDRYYLASRLSEVIKKPLQAEALPLKNIALKKNNVDFEFEVEKLKFRYNIKNATVAFIDSVEEEARTPRWPLFSPDSSWIVFAKNHDLHLMRADDPDSVELRLTTDGERWYSYAANDADTSGDRSASRGPGSNSPLAMRRRGT